MTITWDGKTYTCRKLATEGGRFKPGDFMLYRGELVQVATVQKECFAIENLHQFVQITLFTRDGRVIPERTLSRREVFRPVR